MATVIDLTEDDIDLSYPERSQKSRGRRHGPDVARPRPVVVIGDEDVIDITSSISRGRCRIRKRKRAQAGQPQPAQPAVAPSRRVISAIDVLGGEDAFEFFAGSATPSPGAGGPNEELAGEQDLQQAPKRHHTLSASSQQPSPLPQPVPVMVGQTQATDTAGEQELQQAPMRHLTPSASSQQPSPLPQPVPVMVGRTQATDTAALVLKNKIRQARSRMPAKPPQALSSRRAGRSSPSLSNSMPRPQAESTPLVTRPDSLLGNSLRRNILAAQAESRKHHVALQARTRLARAAAAEPSNEITPIKGGGALASALQPSRSPQSPPLALALSPHPLPPNQPRPAPQARPSRKKPSLISRQLEMSMEITINKDRDPLTGILSLAYLFDRCRLWPPRSLWEMLMSVVSTADASLPSGRAASVTEHAVTAGQSGFPESAPAAVVRMCGEVLRRITLSCEANTLQFVWQPENFKVVREALDTIARGGADGHHGSAALVGVCAVQYVADGSVVHTTEVSNTLLRVESCSLCASMQGDDEGLRGNIAAMVAAAVAAAGSQADVCDVRHVCAIAQQALACGRAHSDFREFDAADAASRAYVALPHDAAKSRALQTLIRELPQLALVLLNRLVQDQFACGSTSAQPEDGTPFPRLVHAITVTLRCELWPGTEPRPYHLALLWHYLQAVVSTEKSSVTRLADKWQTAAQETAVGLEERHGSS
ncbi:uncharacterized protein AMSG_07191 [Thecamonas trahens ATCC 50062]|uniref:Uncharacterized protein n=1 Tax=Thecamonas trahens ATCC 50062 TaxID=461836 RepID=A0A0L0DFJ8_THETB|nr:hypothetical protein AMSG_07191 [Thecamonas trahens ATCC 50062]KNC50941.1 hypothetical protein AMSG_07191 [Thecamonas trahens ATCC 50062]|eukprot:XP_013756638.1 hypothetical protein AMSG_07191 [Thecamonas trahens ATCC 50062]